MSVNAYPLSATPSSLSSRSCRSRCRRSASAVVVSKATRRIPDAVLGGDITICPSRTAARNAVNRHDWMREQVVLDQAAVGALRTRPQPDPRLRPDCEPLTDRDHVTRRAARQTHSLERLGGVTSNRQDDGPTPGSSGGGAKETSNQAGRTVIRTANSSKRACGPYLRQLSRKGSKSPHQPVTKALTTISMPRSTRSGPTAINTEDTRAPASQPRM